jgi:hypothetical protein
MSLIVARDWLHGQSYFAVSWVVRPAGDEDAANVVRSRVLEVVDDA